MRRRGSEGGNGPAAVRCPASTAMPPRSLPLVSSSHISVIKLLTGVTKLKLSRKLGKDALVALVKNHKNRLTELSINEWTDATLAQNGWKEAVLACIAALPLLTHLKLTLVENSSP